jgi:hypothetical protein
MILKRAFRWTLLLVAQLAGVSVTLWARASASADFEDS